jgi:ABC-type amino acid transport substrate-binding protein
MIDTTFLSSFEEKHPNSLAVLQTLPTQESFAVATKKQDIALVQNFNTFFAQWKQTPQYQKLYQSYFPAPAN